MNNTLTIQQLADEIGKIALAEQSNKDFSVLGLIAENQHLSLIVQVTTPPLHNEKLKGQLFVSVWSELGRLYIDQLGREAFITTEKVMAAFINSLIEKSGVSVVKGYTPKDCSILKSTDNSFSALARWKKYQDADVEWVSKMKSLYGSSGTSTQTVEEASNKS